MFNFLSKRFLIDVKSYVLLLFVVFGITQSLYSQEYTPYQDSLIKVLKTKQTRHQRFNTYFELVDDLYMSYKEKEGNIFYEKMEKFVQKNDIKSGKGCLSILKSYKSFYIKDDVSNAIIYGIEGTEALKMAADTSYSIKVNLAIAIDELGYFYEKVGMYDKALSAYLDAVDFSKRFKYKYGEMVATNSLFFLHSEYFNDDETGIKYLKEALKIAEEIKDVTYISILNGNLAMLYIKMNEMQKGELFLEKAIKTRTEQKDTLGLAHAYLEKARLYFKQEDLKKARINIEKCLTFAPQKCDWCYKVQITKGQISKAERKFKEAEQCFLLAQDLINFVPNLSKKYTILIHLAMLAKDRNEDKKAADYYAEAFLVKDSIDSQWAVGNAMKIQTQAKVTKIEDEKKALQFEKELLAIKLNSQQKVVFLMVLLLCVAVSSAIFIFLQKNKLSKAYHVLVQKNRALAASILKKEVEKTKIISDETGDEKRISNELEMALLEKIKKALESDKVFLDSGLSLSNFAQLLNTNTTYLSKIINNHYNKRFSTLINEYRIKEILLYFESNRLKDLTIFALAQEAGFNSKSAFNNAFKEYTGVTPTFYLKSIEKNAKSKPKYVLDTV